MNSRIGLFIVSSVLMLFIAITTGTAFAHQPYCEFSDVTADSPWQVPDAAVSYAYYGNLYPAEDVDYFTFDAMAGQDVLLSLSIPAIEGQEDFAPVMMVSGPGVVGEAVTPERVAILTDYDAMMVDVGEEPEYWFEPFGRQYYWTFENAFFEAPEDATYTVALWHPEERLGRYAFVVGEREVIGGDLECLSSMSSYWTPLLDGENPYRDATAEDDSHTHAGGEEHDHSKLMDMDAGSAPIVDLQVIPLEDGGYNVRIQTMNFIFTPQNIDQEPVMGEGHAHLYVDGVKIARVYGEWYHIASLPDDAQMISVGLYANNHQPLAVDGVEITDMVMLADINK